MIHNERCEFLPPENNSELAVLYAEVALGASQKSFFNWTFDSALQELNVSKSLIIYHEHQLGAFLTFREYADRIEIMAVGTRQELLRQGYGTLIIERLKEYAAQRSVPLWLEVHENNQSAVKFYLKNHFFTINQRKSYYLDGGTALVMKFSGN